MCLHLLCSLTLNETMQADDNKYAILYLVVVVSSQKKKIHTGAEGTLLHLHLPILFVCCPGSPRVERALPGIGAAETLHLFQRRRKALLISTL